jgi:hypothetical protein
VERLRGVALLLGAVGVAGALAALLDCSFLVDTSGLAGSSAPADAIAEASSPCVAPHTFCDDFDQGALGARWSSETSDAGYLSLDPSTWVSPPNSLLAFVGPNRQANITVVGLSKIFAGSARGAHCEWDLMVDALSSTEEVEVFNFAIASATGDFAGYNLSVHLRSDLTKFIEFFGPGDGGAPGGSVHELASLPTRTWSHVVVDLSFPGGSTSAGSAAISLNFAPPTQLPLTPPLANLSQTLAMGVSGAYSGTQVWTVHDDNVFCDLTF